MALEEARVPHARGGVEAAMDSLRASASAPAPKPSTMTSAKALST
jgi:hypothetical protein